jgi:hypothetical protein
MLLMMIASLTFSSRATARIALIGRMIVLLALALSVQPLFSSQAAAQDDVGLPMHPRAIPSTIVRQSGEGEGTRWIRVSFATNAPYKQVVGFYREKVGRDAQISQIDSGKLLNTLILASRDPADQFNINISSELGRKVTQVELSRNSARP